MISLNTFISLTKLLRLTAWVRRFAKNLKGKKLGNTIDDKVLRVSELKKAELEWVEYRSWRTTN